MDKLLFEDEIEDLFNEFIREQEKITDENISKIVINNNSNGEIEIFRKIEEKNDVFDYSKWKTFPELLNALRKRPNGREYTDSDIASLSGLTQDTIEGYVHGVHVPTTRSLIRICIGLGIGMYGFVCMLSVCGKNIYGYPILINWIGKILDFFSELENQEPKYKRCDAREVVEGIELSKDQIYSYKIQKYDAFESEFAPICNKILDQKPRQKNKTKNKTK